jgi:hypothetical protein
MTGPEKEEAKKLEEYARTLGLELHLNTHPDKMKELIVAHKQKLADAEKTGSDDGDDSGDKPEEKTEVVKSVSTKPYWMTRGIPEKK